MKRLAIVLVKKLGIGSACNISSILLGQLAATNSDIYSQQPIIDLDGVQHAGINFSTVVLQASSPTQLANFVTKIRVEAECTSIVVFSRCGQQLNNQPGQHRLEISAKRLQEAEPLGIAIFGDDLQIRQLTKRFSVLH